MYKDGELCVALKRGWLVVSKQQNYTKLGFEMAKKMNKGNVAGILRLFLLAVLFLVKYVSFFNHG
jgi:hypothetical protein